MRTNCQATAKLYAMRNAQEKWLDKKIVSTNGFYNTKCEWRSTANNDNPNSAYDRRTHTHTLAHTSMQLTKLSKNHRVCDSKMSPNGEKCRAKEGTIVEVNFSLVDSRSVIVCVCLYNAQMSKQQSPSAAIESNKFNYFLFPCWFRCGSNKQSLVCVSRISLLDFACSVYHKYFRRVNGNSRRFVGLWIRFICGYSRIRE